MSAGQRRIDHSFYDREVVDVARELVGCTLLCRGTSGVIVETEAYRQDEPACHAWRGKTARTAPLFGPPGLAYVYFTYGMHWMLNAVCDSQTAAAVLLRAVIPVQGVETMRERRERVRPLKDTQLCSGPAKLVQAMGVLPTDNERDLTGLAVADEEADELAIVWDEQAARETGVLGAPIVAGVRIGITLAVELPWRFGVRTPFLSRSFPADAPDVGSVAAPRVGLEPAKSLRR